MIGGTVVETIVLEDRVWVDCEEDNSTSKCAIYVVRNKRSEAIKPSDSIWWQGSWAMWTPYKHRGNDPRKPGFVKGRKSGKDYDIRIQRIGSSGVAKPLKYLVV
jgi:hypothetical protein